MNTEKQEWREEFDRRYAESNIDLYYKGDRDNVKSFISEQIEKAEKRGYAEGTDKGYFEGREDGRIEGYNSALLKLKK